MKIVMIGGSGAVGGHAVRSMLSLPQVDKLTLLGRRKMDSISDDRVVQHTINIFATASYVDLLPGHDAAICTLGVGQPSKVSKEEFIRIDKQAVLDFATRCKAAGVRHFELLSSVGISSKSKSFYLRTKGELVDDMERLNFERFSVFKPSMILTPTNRYGLSQAITLKVWPLLSMVLVGGLKKYRGVDVDVLGESITANLLTVGEGVEYLDWSDFMDLVANSNLKTHGSD